MKRLIVILSLACLFLIAISVFIKPVIIFVVKKQLGNIFIQSRISVEKCTFQPTRGLSLFDIEIKRQGDYDIKVREAAIGWNLHSLATAASLKLSLNGIKIYVNNSQKGFRDFSGYVVFGRGSPIFKSVEISDLDVDLNTLDLTAKANLSLGLNLVSQSLDHLDFKMDIFKMLGAQIENVSVKLGPGSEQGNFSIAQLKYDKLNIDGIKGKVRRQGAAVSFYDVSGRVLDGDIRGNLDLKIGQEAWYLVNLQCTDLDIEKLVSDFNLREKFEMTGRLSGDLKLQGKGAQIEIMGGHFVTRQPGGTLVIKDTKFLENMARNTKQPVDLLIESFKNYRYNTGLVNLGLENGNVILATDLQGEAGKRSLNVVLHDVTIKKEGL